MRSKLVRSAMFAMFALMIDLQLASEIPLVQT